MSAGNCRNPFATSTASAREMSKRPWQQAVQPLPHCICEAYFSRICRNHSSIFGLPILSNPEVYSVLTVFVFDDLITPFCVRIRGRESNEVFRGYGGGL